MITAHGLFAYVGHPLHGSWNNDIWHSLLVGIAIHHPMILVVPIPWPGLENPHPGCLGVKVWLGSYFRRTAIFAAKPGRGKVVVPCRGTSLKRKMQIAFFMERLNVH